MEGRTLLGQKPLQRWFSMEIMEANNITLGETGKKMGISYHHPKQIKIKNN
jgi:hypothetical protein